MNAINPTISFLDEYDGDDKKIRCICTVCGNQWMATPGKLLCGRGCPECGKKKQVEKQRKSQEQFVSELSSKNQNIEVLGVYVNSKTHIEVKCKKCGYIWAPFPNSLLRGTGCPQCAGNKKRTHEEFIDLLKEINPEVEVLENYKNTDAKIKVKCKNCGKEWYTSPNNLLDGHGCGRCVGRKNHNDFVEALKTINPNVEVIGQYINGNTHIAVKCRVCGNEWKSRPSQLLKGRGCLKCGRIKQADSLRKTQEAFEKEIEEINKNIFVVGHYINNMTPIEVKCKKCDYVWQSLPGNLLKGQGCPKCAKYLHTSFPEQAVFFYVRKSYPDAINGYKGLLANNMELDVFIPSKRVGIEYDGRAWHKGSKANTNEIKKYEACKENSIKLVRIKEFQQESDSLTADLILYADVTLEKTLKKVAEMLGVEFDIDLERDRNKIFDQYKNVNSNDEFIKKLSNKNPDVIPLSKYTLSNNKIYCKCKKCSFEWMATPNKLLDGRGCPKCSGRMRKNTKQYIEDLERLNPNIEVIGEYKNSSSPIDVRCKTCCYEWRPIANSLLRGNGCPRCSHRERISQEQFINELSIVNPNILVLGDYKTKKTPILVKCKKCGREWQPTPDSLLRNHGCSRCAGQLKKTTEEFANELNRINDRFQVIGEYINARTKIKVICRDCGFERNATPDSLLRGLRCPQCDKKKQSQTRD